jgi:hypothetical protein
MEVGDASVSGVEDALVDLADLAYPGDPLTM